MPTDWSKYNAERRKDRSIKPSNVNGDALGGNATRTVQNLRSAKLHICGGTIKTPHYENETGRGGLSIARSALALSFRNLASSVVTKLRATTRITASP